MEMLCFIGAHVSLAGAGDGRHNRRTVIGEGFDSPMRANMYVAMRRVNSVASRLLHTFTVCFIFTCHQFQHGYRDMSDCMGLYDNACYIGIF